MSNKKIRIGILGTADIAQRSMIPALFDLHSEYDLVAIASRSFDSAAQVSKRYGVQAFGTYEEIIDPKIVDAIYIPLPNSLHYEWIKRCLEKGLHVLVEKSMCTHFVEVEEVNNLARNNNLVLLENFQFRFHPQLTKIKEIIDSGELGKLKCLRSSFGFPPFQSKENIRYKQELGGGSLLDAGAYTTKISQVLLGLNLTVKTATLHYDQNLGVDLSGGAYFENDTGVFSQLAFGFDHQYQCSLELWGSLGQLVTHRLFTAPSNYQVELLIKRGTETHTYEINAENHFENMLRYFYFLVNSKEQEKLEEEYKQNIDQARLIDDIKKCAQSQ